MSGTLIGFKSDATFTSTTLQTLGVGFRVGTRNTDYLGNEWIFIQASAAITQYDCVRIGRAYKAAGITIDTAKEATEVGFAQVALAADEYGWVMQGGRPLVRLAADCDIDLALYATANAGILDDATVSAMISGCVSESSVTNAVVGGTCLVRFPQAVRAVTLGAV